MVIMIKYIRAKRTCPPMPCGGVLSAFGGSRLIEEYFLLDSLPEFCTSQVLNRLIL